MRPRDMEGILNVLKMMVEAELSFGRFYTACAEKWPRDAEFWHALVNQEYSHAEAIERMAGRIAKKPESFHVKRPFNVDAVKTIIKVVERGMERMEKGEVDERKALVIARDFEQSLIEAKYSELVATDDVEYNELVKKIEAQTRAHKGLIEGRLA